MNGRTLARVALALALSGCSLLSPEEEAPPAATPAPAAEVADEEPAQALPVGDPVPMPMAPTLPSGTAPPEGAADGPDGVYDIEE